MSLYKWFPITKINLKIHNKKPGSFHGIKPGLKIEENLISTPEIGKRAKVKTKNPLLKAGKYKRKEALMRPTSIYSLSAELGANTIDPYELNCRVRNGNGCCLVGINISLIKASRIKEQI